MTDCASDTTDQNVIQIVTNSSFELYRCQNSYHLASGDLLRMCVNGTWTGTKPSCLVDSVLSKQLLVLLIVGITFILFSFWIPFDFYRFRKKKQSFREKQQRIDMMVRIQPMHPKTIGMQSLGTSEDEPPANRSFGFGSIMAFFRLVRNKRKQRKATTPSSETPTDDGKSPLPTVSSTSPMRPDEPEIISTSPRTKPTTSLEEPDIRQMPSGTRNAPQDEPDVRTDPLRTQNNPRLPPLSRAQSLSSGIKVDLVKVAPKSASFTDSQSILGKQKTENTLITINTPEGGTSPRRISIIDEFMDERGADNSMNRPNTRHPSATRNSRPQLCLSMTMTRYSRGINSTSNNPLPSVGSSPSHMSLRLDNGF